MAVPYFAYGENGESVSLLTYLAFPGDYGEATAWMGTQVEGYEINQLANVHVGLFLGVIVAGILLVALRDNPVSSAVAAGVGIWGLVAYATNSVLRLGGAGRTIHMVLLGAVVVLGLVTLLAQIMPAIRGRSEIPSNTNVQKQAMAS